MFSFHKPKIYRSIKGCCICRAKSSSSRFTDSKRYEHDFDRCFQIKEHRAGEICNACVLLVKRWKKLPSGSTRNWHHVVDARAGPGTKSMNKIKNKAKEEKERKNLAKHKHKHKKRVLKAPGGSVSAPCSAPQSPGSYSDDLVDCLSDGASDYLSNSDSEDEVISAPQKLRNRRKLSTPMQFSSFLDLTYWKKTEVCCGIIFKGANGEVLLDTSLWRPCSSCKPSSLSRQDSQSVASDESDDNSSITSPHSPAAAISASMPSSPQCRPLSPAMPMSLSMPASPSSCPRSPPMLESILELDMDMDDSRDTQSLTSSSTSTATDPLFTDSTRAQLDCLTAAARAAESATASAILDLSIPKPPLLSRAEPCRPIVQMEV